MRVSVVLLVRCRGLGRCRAEKHRCVLVCFDVGVWQATSLITSGCEIGEGIFFLYWRLAAHRLEHNLVGVLSQALWVLADLACSDDQS